MNAMAIEPYKALMTAMLEQAIRDIRHGPSEVRKSAYRWLQHDRCCADLCEWIGLSRTALAETLGRELR